MRVMDFLKSLDEIVDSAIEEKVDLVIFAGDTYKDRSPAPTFQREWGRRIMRLSKAKIPTLLLVGNHDLSPALGRAHALDEFATLEVPHVRVLDKPEFIGDEVLYYVANDLNDSLTNHTFGSPPLGLEFQGNIQLLILCGIFQADLIFGYKTHLALMLS